jgi:hypothetical protein
MSSAVAVSVWQILPVNLSLVAESSGFEND